MIEKKKFQLKDYAPQVVWLLTIVFMFLMWYFNVSYHINNDSCHLKPAEKARIINHLEETEKSEGDYIRKGEFKQFEKRLDRIEAKLDQLIMSK